MLNKQERQKLHEIETRFCEQEPNFVAQFDQLGRPASADASRLRPILLMLLTLFVLGAVSASFFAGALVGIVVLGSTASLVVLTLLLHRFRRGR